MEISFQHALSRPRCYHSEHTLYLFLISENIIKWLSFYGLFAVFYVYASICCSFCLCCFVLLSISRLGYYNPRSIYIYIYIYIKGASIAWTTHTRNNRHEEKHYLQLRLGQHTSHSGAWHSKKFNISKPYMMSQMLNYVPTLDMFQSGGT